MTSYTALMLIAQTLAATRVDQTLQARWRDSSADWPLLLETATRHRVAGVLCTALRAHGLFAQLPEPFQATLDALRELGRERNDALLHQAMELARVLNLSGITPVFLKGTAHLLEGLYADNGDRLVGDVDILVRPEELSRSIEALAGAGYVANSADDFHPDGSPRGDVHYPPLVHPGCPMVVEVHWALLPKPLSEALVNWGIFEQVRHRRTPEGTCYGLLEPARELGYGILHAQQRHRLSLFHTTRLWHLYDSLLLSRRLDSEQLARVSALMEASQCKRHFRHHAAAMSEMFGLSGLPSGFQVPMSQMARWRMRGHVNRTRLAALDRAAGGVLAAGQRELRDLALQWRDPAHRGPLIRKLFRPASYHRRLCNLFAWFRIQARPD